MATNINQSAVKVWFRYLQMAINNNVPINWDFYKDWGTKNELSTLKFNTWWNLKGKSLFEQHQATVSVVKSDESGLTIHIPDHLTAKEANKMINKLVVARRGSRRIKNKGAYSASGEVKYNKLIQYQRYLDIELDPRYSGKTTEEKAKALLQFYKKNDSSILKRKETMKKRGYPKVKNIKINDRDYTGIDPKKISKWLLNAKHLLLNVAEGTFPGKSDSYSGDGLKAKLEARLKKLGIETIGSVVKAKGGRKRVRITKEEKERRAKLSLLAYRVNID